MTSHHNNKIRSLISGSIFVILLSVLIYSCSNPSESTTTVVSDDNILRTDSTGRILGGDYTDWCFMDSISKRHFWPAYPNPTYDTFSVNFDVPVADTLSLYFYNGSDSTFIFKKLPFQPGTYTARSSGVAYGFSNSFRRLYIRNKNGLFPTSSTCNNFGDIHFR